MDKLMGGWKTWVAAIGLIGLGNKLDKAAKAGG